MKRRRGQGCRGRRQPPAAAAWPSALAREIVDVDDSDTDELLVVLTGSARSARRRSVDELTRGARARAGSAGARYSLVLAVLLCSARRSAYDLGTSCKIVIADGRRRESIEGGDDGNGGGSAATIRHPLLLADVSPSAVPCRSSIRAASALGLALTLPVEALGSDARLDYLRRSLKGRASAAARRHSASAAAQSGRDRLNLARSWPTRLSGQAKINPVLLGGPSSALLTSRSALTARG